MIQILADALAVRGYDTLTPVQEAVTDPAVQEADLLVSAQTGSGKTVGFGLAIGPDLLIEDGRLPKADKPLALIIAPTRELAFQVMRELAWLYQPAGAIVTACVGGMDMREERRTLARGAHIVVATPGRLRDHIQRGSLEMGNLRAIVLDEADEMLDLGFREDLEFILGEAPPARRTLMFSATVPPAIAELAKLYQRDAVRISTTTGNRQHADITYHAMLTSDRDSENAIINVLRFHDAQNAIVFANTRAMVARLAARFSNRGFSVVSLSGELSQTERTHALQAMRDGRARVCIATDVAARGIDLPNLELVIHAELPSNAEGLLHRSGRTGRAGRKGVSTLIVTPKSRKKAERLLKFAKITAEWVAPPSADEILRRDEERLLSDPVWTEEIGEAEAAFADTLLDLHDARTIAAAYLRLYRKGQSAPEDLAPPEERPAPRPAGDFGPSVWFSIGVGKQGRAEARWLLPMVCRAGGITKDEIGAIRVQFNETFIEIAQSAVEGFAAQIGPGGTLDDGIAITRLDKAPDLAARPQFEKPRRAPAPRPLTEASPKPAPRRAPPKPQEVAVPVRPAPKAKRWGNDEAAASKPSPSRPAGPAKRWEARPERPGADAPRPAAKPKRWEAKPERAEGSKPVQKPKRWEGKPDRSEAPARKGDWADKKPRPTAPRAKPVADAKDTSKRFVPPGGKPSPRAAKEGGKDGTKRFGAPDASKSRKPRVGKGGDAKPRRTKT